MTAGGVHWLASYPKSGNTWVRIALASLVKGGRLPDLARGTELCPNAAALVWMEEVLDLPVVDMTTEEQALMRTEACRLYPTAARPPAILKIHDSYDPSLLAPVPCAGTILIVRDPRDVVPSLADHLSIGIDDAIARMGCPRFTISSRGAKPPIHALQRLGDWSANVRSWLDEAPGAKLLLRYEDMLAAPAASFEALVRFTGLQVDTAVIRESVAATSFESLRAEEARSGFSERRHNQKAFFRQGQAGTWRQSLSAAQAERVWNDHQAIMMRLGYRDDGTIADLPAGMQAS
ncbi:sulfotransferase domain-containing protein [Ancylobacter sp. IITR112]|uniref:sulfotransferase domain-containing protein n=1 Tax=Ancylobacter sp. IITR112 TaxID=3138073 RepID=UPI00352B164A